MLKLTPEVDELLYYEAGKAGMTKSGFVTAAIYAKIASDKQKTTNKKYE